MFRFKQFAVEDSISSMKVGTDAVILGAWTNASGHTRILEIGTGCGVISLMLAQKTEAIIDAIDIDQGSAEQAGDNFSKSPWSGRLNSHCISLEDFCGISRNMYDLIVCNPPYFTDSLKPGTLRKTRSRHTVSLSPGQLYQFASRLSEPYGLMYCIVPVSEEHLHMKEAASNGYFCLEKLNVKATEQKEPYIVGLKFGKSGEVPLFEHSLVIKDANNRYTDDYIILTKDFYLYF